VIRTALGAGRLSWPNYGRSIAFIEIADIAAQSSIHVAAVQGNSRLQLKRLNGHHGEKLMDRACEIELHDAEQQGVGPVLRMLNG
jgi:hypothetical protein